MTLGEMQKTYRDGLLKIYDEGEARAISRLVFETVLQLNPTALSFERFRILTQPQQQQLEDILKRLLTHEPAQYILGEAHFMGLALKVSPAVLIPRPETEELVSWILETAGKESTARILDIGTGSGCIPVALALKLKRASLTALDISEDALKVAAENARLQNVKLDLRQMDILKESPAVGSFDVIVSNPPYITDAEKNQMAANVLAHEPHLALFVEGNDAILFYRVIAEKAIKVLTPGGYLFYELNPETADEVLVLFATGSWQHAEIRKDLSGKKRMLRVQKATTA